MSTIHGITELGPATAKRQVYSPLETYWNAFQEWRKRRRLMANLCDLSDRELVIWNSSSSHNMIARISTEESACGECRCERPADRTVGSESAGADVLREASSSSSCCAVAI